MANYIGQVQIENGSTTSTALVGSTLYGICNTNANTAAKTVLSGDASAITLDNTNTKFINNNFGTLLQGVTIHVKFVQGNNVTSGMTLQVGTIQTAQDVVGNCTCPAGTIISFTLDENQKWVVNDNVDTNTEYVFKTAYNASTNKAVTESDLTDLNIQAAAHKAVITDISSNTSSTDLPTTAAVVSYVTTQTGGLSGLTGAMHFKGTVDPLPTATDTTTYNTYDSGDVVLGPDYKEYVYIKAASSAESEWIELGDESSYALKSSTDTITEVGTFTTNTLPTLTVSNTSIPNVTDVGEPASLTTDSYSIPNVTATNVPTSAAVSGGILTITLGSAATLGNAFAVESVNTFTANTVPTLGTAISLQNAITFTQGTQASLTTNDTTVVVPDNSNSSSNS